MPLLNVIRLRFVYKPCVSFPSKTIALSSPSKPLFSPFVTLLTIKHCSAVPCVFIIIIIITSNDDPKPSTVLSEQSPTELIAID